MRGTIDDPIPRTAARVLLVNAAHQVLLFRGFDPANPGERYWFTVGGGLDDGELPAEGAARELREETGLAVDPAVLGRPVWQQVTMFPFDGRWYRQEQDFFVARVESWAVSEAGFDPIEQRSIDAHRWWTADELDGTDERYYPEELPQLLREVLGGS